MRHARDPLYGSVLSRPKIRKQSRNTFQTLNTRFIDRNDPLWSVHEELAKVQEGKNLVFPFACQGNNSRRCINWLSMKEILSAIGRKSPPITCPAVFHAPPKGKSPTKSYLEQLLSRRDHNLNRRSLSLPLLAGLQVHTTQNIDFKRVKAMYFQGCPMRLPSQPSEMFTFYLSKKDI